MASHCNPVFYDGLFYCLSKDGKLGIFNPEEEYEDVWKILVRAIFPLQNMEYHLTSLRSFLVEYCGEFFSFFVPVNKPIDVFKLDRSEMKWVRVESLGDKVAFLSHTTSVLVPAGLKGVENRIYLPKFYGIDNMYYSLTTRSFSYFGSKDPCAKWIDSSEIFDCTWFQANL
ncbi:hypothetical protein IFM89_029642 [Coptis chinensis]|uniref:KIB1-4 beta-propeller domain-containing protein n=1 Tax=Coptis chinensis TaxID=261450 RepID=A0A835M1P4_9MAGN|nr:hypothetical protein IFM89_029642 [Coptis chinensis]